MLLKDWVKLSEWARQDGTPYQTARRMFHEGRLPENLEARKLPTGTLMVRVKAGQSQLDRIEGKVDRILEVIEKRESI